MTPYKGESCVKYHEQFIIITNDLAKELSPSEMKIYSVIMQFFPKMYPGIKKICEMSGLSRNTVYKYLKSMETKGVLERLRRKFKTNVYKIGSKFLTLKQNNKMQQAIKEVFTFFSGRPSANSSHLKGIPRVPNSQIVTRTNTYPVAETNFFNVKDGIGEIFKALGMPSRV